MLLVLTGLAVIFYWKVIFRGLVPFPGDLLVGAYYPWLSEKWGFIAGVPVKNTLISDVFSTYFVWKKIMLDSFRLHQFPLWNPYSYSGYPLLATFHSTVLSPFNVFLLLVDMVRGWSLMIFFQTLGALVTMYLFLRTLRLKNMGALGGAITYAFSGFALAWSQFTTAPQAMVWIPLLFLLVEKAFREKQVKYFLLLPVVFLFLVSSGHLQILLFGACLLVCYFLYRLFQTRFHTKKYLGYFSLGILLGVALSAVQLLPTVELMNHSIRFAENYIQQYNYGLLPIGNLITFLAPDYFGNPATNNYWGFFNYHETIVYVGVIGALALVWSLFAWKKLSKIHFFIFTSLVILLFGFNTPLGQLIFRLKVPLISTSAAGRIFAIFAFTDAVIVATFIDEFKKTGRKEIFKAIVCLFLMLIIAFGLSMWFRYLFTPQAQWIPEWMSNTKVALRNLVLPGAILGFVFILTIVRRIKGIQLVLIAILAFDLFRFGWKYLPFVPQQMVFPQMPELQFLQKQSGVFRIDREKAEILTPNTWGYYNLMSPSGYDPMALNDYSSFYANTLSDSKSSVSRYSELSKIDATKLGDLNVKYFLALKHTKDGRIGADGGPSYLIKQKDWNKVFETQTAVVLENKFWKERVQLYKDGLEDKEGKSKITSYTPNKVEIDYSTTKDSQLVLMDTWYPGWKATINDKEQPIDKFRDVFRSVNVPAGEGRVVFKYQPNSFRLGLTISFFALIVEIVLLIPFQITHRLRSLRGRK